MPYKHTEKLIPRKHDRRVKLTEQDRLEIRDLYASGLFSQRKLAEMYGVSRRLIVFIIHPERQKANYQNRVAKGGSKIYYQKEKHTIAMRTHRRYKQNLYLQDKLINKEEPDDKTTEKCS